MEEKKQQLEIALSPEVADGTYSNLAIITHSNSEFIIDFACIMPGAPKANVKSRIVLTPEHAKRLLVALEDNVKKYEQQHGPVQIENNGGGTFVPPMPMFGGGQA